MDESKLGRHSESGCSVSAEMPNYDGLYTNQLGNDMAAHGQTNPRVFLPVAQWHFARCELFTSRLKTVETSTTVFSLE